jgi:hypothetical protein
VKIGAVAILIAVTPLSAAYGRPQLGSDMTLSTAGYFRLNWEDEAGADFKLEQAPSSDFNDARVLYQGQDKATVISGLANGHYFYRVGNTGTGQWSDPLEVEVKHHSLTRAFAFFSLGAAMFLATLGVLVFGSRRQQH